MFVVAKSATDPRWLLRRSPPFRPAAPAIAKMSAADAAEIDRLLSQADQVSAKVRKSFLDAIARIDAQIDVGELKALLQQGRVDQALQLVNSHLSAAGFQPVANTITAGAIQAARAAEPALSAANVSFGAMNPHTVDFLRTYEMGLVRQLGADARASVASAVRAGVSAGRNPLDVARDVRQFIGLTENQTRAVLNYRRMLENGSRDALQRALRDRRFDASVLRAIEDGAAMMPEKVDRLVARYTERYLRYRSETIARTESIRAVNSGNNLLWRQAVHDGRFGADQVTKTWATVVDNKVRHAHVELDGTTVKLNENFQCSAGPIAYPGDPNASPENTCNCRCAVLYRFKLRPRT
ncbi:phage minor head protein [Bradyrhizobium sp. CCBAU 51753]|uniref:phage minor head protein n=1 Tax=Bradyrhizobium sp. CCBAU 51753 TaxID=1325100 RepID=UPI00188C5978|nr:phage minor head protein [Bradyrhizobium sp. CCBAU 51753]QOZ25297.1 hypothetical protein XH93_18145 [Bradyrhizobium sp. CCBAU 51753]